MSSELTATELLLRHVNADHLQEVERLRAMTRDSERRAEAYAKETVLEAGLAGTEFVSENARQEARQLLGANLRVSALDGKLAVKGPTWEDGQEYVRTKIADPSWSHFIRPAKPATTTTTTTPAPTGPEQAPGESLGANYIRRWREGESARQASGDARLDPRQSFGLKGKRR
jgi:hypothetical protein